LGVFSFKVSKEWGGKPQNKKKINSGIRNTKFYADFYSTEKNVKNYLTKFINKKRKKLSFPFLTVYQSFGLYASLTTFCNFANGFEISIKFFAFWSFDFCQKC
jgi:hypothetical protein